MALPSERVVEIDPSIIYFTFSRIYPQFSCGRTIAYTLQQFEAGELTPTDLPLLSVLTDGQHYYSQNNRRLFLYKTLQRDGRLQTVPVRLRPLPQTRRMKAKYTPAKCAMTATLIREGKAEDQEEEAASPTDGRVASVAQPPKYTSNATNAEVGDKAGSSEQASHLPQRSSRRSKKKSKAKESHTTDEDDRRGRERTRDTLEEELKTLGL